MLIVFGSLFVAGTDTTSLALSWAMYYLVKNPAAFSRCRTEGLKVAPMRYAEKSACRPSAVPRRVVDTAVSVSLDVALFESKQHGTGVLESRSSCQ